MRRARARICQAVTGVTLGIAGFSLASPISYDLRFDDGSHIKQALPNTTYHLEAWMRVTGTNGIHTDDAMFESYLVAASTQLNGGAIASGGLANGQVVAPFNSTAARNGQSASITSDGISDWGNLDLYNGPAGAAMLAEASGNLFAGGSVGQAVDANTWEFKIATFDLAIAGINGGIGSTRFNIVDARTSTFAIGLTYAGARVDGSFSRLDANQPGDAFSSSPGVSVFVPEASALGVFGAVSIGLLSRVRRVNGN